MAKAIEIENGGTGLDCETESAQRFAAYQYARINYDLLWRFGPQAYKDAAEGQLTEALRRVSFTNIALTGIVSSLTRGFHQTAHAHRLYDGLRTFFGQESKPWLHGELVAIGLILQLVYNGAEEQVSELQAFMRSMNMPTSLSEIGISTSDAQFKELYDYIMHTEFVGEDSLWHERIAQGFEAIA